jgi:uncharacterized protein
MGRYNEIAQSLDGHRDDLNPIFWEDAEGDVVIAADWAEGFLEAIKMRADAWAPLIRNKQAGDPTPAFRAIASWDFPPLNG